MPIVGICKLAECSATLFARFHGKITKKIQNKNSKNKKSKNIGPLHWFGRKRDPQPTVVKGLVKLLYIFNQISIKLSGIPCSLIITFSTFLIKPDRKVDFYLVTS
jgi:hypothetical protein